MVSEDRTGPLAGLVVVDLTRVLAGPFAGLLFADLGARVIKVERPGSGDDTRGYGPFAPDGRSYYFARVNRGKESIALDLRADRDQLLALVRGADVLLENFRPGVMDRLGLGYDTLAEVGPRLVYASISGYGQSGPWRDRPAYDATVQAAAGLMSITGEPDGPPVRPGTSIADLAAGLYGFGAVLAALHARERTGRGCHVDVAMFDATVSLLEGAALETLATGATPARVGSAHRTIAPFGSFAARDGQLVICAGNDELFVRACAAIGSPMLATDPRYRGNSARIAHVRELTADLEAVLGGGDVAHWAAALEAAGVPCAPVASVPEALGSPQAAARRLVVTAGGLQLPGQVAKLSGYADPAVRTAAPELDEHGKSLRSEFPA
ncbi:MAG: CoA:oxalate CoA-transferase [Cryptosporangiaceae bacterium]|jgi:CoA:oxalate CoA-transferase|nr:CoA:oxalate CoA-transferase [Cryptosporangiaceae bacterium]